MTARLVALRAVLAGLMALLLLAGGLGSTFIDSARADTAPLDPANPTTPTTVTADPLPTVQINGVAWAQVVVGNKVYVAGRFTTARPAGAAPGTQEVPRGNLLAYDIRTGALDVTFAPSLNAQANAIAASPDGSRIYVGGDFTLADGQARSRVAAYSTVTGQLVSDFKPAFDGKVQALAATNTAVYAGGWFNAVGTSARRHLAAVSAANGALLPWAPVPAAGPVVDPEDAVRALVVTSGGTQVVIGGHFGYLNGVKATGLGAVDATTGATRPFAINQILTNEGVNSAIFSLSTQGDAVYGTGYVWVNSKGTLEGAFAAAADGGALRWLADCHGDHYSNFAANGALYLASHAHECDNIGAFREQNPQVFNHGTAVSLAPAGKVVAADQWNPNFTGKPAPALLPWFPRFTAGTFTGQYQAGWSVTGNSEYVVYGGEFPRVNNTAQQGLVRFAVPALAPNKVGPETTGTWAPSVSAVTGAVRVSWKALNDQDNENLTYSVYRDSTATEPVCRVARSSSWWNLPTYACADTAAIAGTHQYLVRASDPAGNTVSSTWASISVPSTSVGAARGYTEAVTADGAIAHWALNEKSGSTAYDDAGLSDMTINSGVTRGRPGGIAGDGNTAFQFNGSTSGYLATKTPVTAPQTFAVEAWFQTTSTSGGKIIGFGDQNTTASGVFDRHVYLDTAGRVYWGVYDGTIKTINTTRAYNDGQWHHVVASLSSAGTTLHVDGALIGTRADAKTGWPFSGYWRIGGDSPWTGAGYLPGHIDEPALYAGPLTDAQIKRHYDLGRGVNLAPTAAFTSTVTDLTVAVDGSGATDTDGTIRTYAWDFGGGVVTSGATASHTYAAAGTYPVRLTVTDDDGATGTVTQSVTVAAAAPTTVVGADSFGREVTGGWATADVGGLWTISGSSATPTVTGGSGRLSAAASGTSAASLPVSMQDGTVQADLLLEKAPTGGGSFVSLVGRDQGGSTRYSTQLRYSATGSVTASLTQTVNTAETVLGSYRMATNYTPGTVLTVRFEVTGTAPTTLRAKVWASGTAEPADWQVTATDATAALQKAGGVRVDLYQSGTATGVQTLRVDNVRAVRPGTAPPPAANVAPTAAFTSTVNGLGVAVDGAGSSDSDGSVTGYAWNFGGGVTKTGATASHTFAAAGTYPVTLTVTDDDGATGTVTRSVTVTAPPPATTPPLASDTFGRSVTGGWGTADVGGLWTIIGAAADAVVAEGTGRLTAAAGSTRAAQVTISARDIDVRADLVVDRAPTGGGSYVSLVSRTVAQSRYAVQLRYSATGSVTASLLTVVDGVETTLGSYRLAGTYVPGTALTVRFETAGNGTTSLRAKVWTTGTTEPADWQVSATDTTAALQRAGAARVDLYNSGTATGAQTVRVDNLWIGTPGQTPPAP